ncbi:MAG: ABC transporter permease [Armatimonadetes bacterium]|nr:ABC transporter permease [Armatimonadota bacterium]
MGVFESFRVAWDMLRLHKLRAFLTMLGVIIGVMSVSLIAEVSGGFNHFLTDEIKKLGSDTIIVFFDPGRNQGRGLGKVDKLTNDDIDYIRNRASSIDLVSGIYQGPVDTIRHGDRTLKNPRIFATDENQAQLSRVGITKGRHMNHQDLADLANVCVIGDETAQRLFGDKEALGQTVTMRGLTLEVIGVMERIDIMGQTNGRDVWLPLTTAQKKWLGGDAVSYITARPKEGFTVQQAMDDVWQIMMRKSNNRPIYRVDSRESIITVFGVMVGVAGGMLSGVAALSLLVGGIGIMNIMLVSVTERTREIGLRKAVGATKSAVLTQFLVESMLLSLVGGLMGMALAWLLGQGITLVTVQLKQPTKAGFQMPFDPITATVATAVSLLIGVVFGIYPAAKASSLSPIEALRME